MADNLLIVEDDEYLREILEHFISGKGYAVTAVPNGKVAKDIFLAGDFKLVLSDVQMPYMNGVEFLQWLRQHSKVPFILMTGFTNLLETQKASDLGADGFLSKPFSNADLAKMVADLLAPPVLPTIPPEELEAQYCKVSIDEFVARPKIEHDIFIRLQTGRFLKIAHLGETLDVVRLRSYREKGVAFLHIKKEDFNKLVDFNLEISKVLSKKTNVSQEKKARFMRYTSETLMERCYVDGVDKKAIVEAKDFLTTVMGTLTDEPQTFNLIEILNEHADYLYAHCLGVSLYSVMIANELNFQSTQTKFKLAMAGLFHDIGKKEIDRAILEKPRPLQTVAERKLIESHVVRSREIMEALTSTPAEVIQIIYEHHEDDIEQGYPCGTPKVRLHPLSRIVQVADIFSTRAIKSPLYPSASSASAMEYIEKFEADKIDKNAYAALQRLVKVKKAA